VALKSCVLVILILLLSTAVCNCCGCLDLIGLSKLNHPRQWYNESFDPSGAPNVTVRISAMALGDTPIRVLDSYSDKINISVLYYTAPKFDDYRHRDNYTVAAYAHYDNDWTQGVGADIYVYLPGNASYTVNIRNMAAGNNSAYDDGSPLLVNYTLGNLTVWLNDPAHPLPWQASALY
jgi:hypothetical protein